jgi:hypothetical protein
MTTSKTGYDDLMHPDKMCGAEPTTVSPSSVPSEGSPLHVLASGFSDKNKGVLQLRPHHVCCIPFLSFDGDNLNREFLQVLTEVKQRLTSDADLAVTVIQGVDDVCRACPSCIESRCDSPHIKEEMVRRVDDFLLGDLGKSYGETLKVSQWRSVIADKWPYRLCRMCRWRAYCGL